MRVNPAEVLYQKIREGIVTAAQGVQIYSIPDLAELMVPGGSQSAWAQANVRNELKAVIEMALADAIFTTAINALCIQVFRGTGTGPRSVGAALPFIAQGGKGKGTAGLAFEYGNTYLLQASQARTAYTFRVAIIHAAEKNTRLAELGAFPAGEIDRLSEPDAFRQLKLN